MTRTSKVAALFALLVTLFTEAQARVTYQIRKPNAVFSEPFTQIDGIRELPDGRVLIVDSREHVVSVVNFAGGNVSVIGRKGSGPAEYNSATSLLPLQGDSAAIVDPRNSRLLLIDSRARLGATISLARLATRNAVAKQNFVPVAADLMGRLYATASGFVPSRLGPTYPDSFPIVRWNRKSDVVEIVAYLRSPTHRDRGGDFDSDRARTEILVPFVIGDQWAVDQDGRVAILRYDGYRVEFVETNGSRTRGSPINYERVRVTEAHRALWRDEQVPDVTIPGATPIPIVPKRWPIEMPPFRRRPARFSPNGVLWVQRTGNVGASTTYDRIDRAGKLIGSVLFLPDSRIVGFGKQNIYVARRDNDGLQTLERFTLQATD